MATTKPKPKKTAVKKTAEKPAKPKKPAPAKKTAAKPKLADGVLDKAALAKLKVSQSAMAWTLGLATSNIIQLADNGSLAKNADGSYDLMECARSYVKALRERKSGNSKSTLETEALQLKNEKAKTYLESWRRTRDRQIAVAILEALKSALLELRDSMARGLPANRAIDAALARIEKNDYEIVLVEIEDEDNDEEE